MADIKYTCNYFHRRIDADAWCYFLQRRGLRVECFQLTDGTHEVRHGPGVPHKDKPKAA